MPSGLNLRSARAVSIVGLQTMKLEIPRDPASGSVTALAPKISPTPACGMKILDPLRSNGFHRT